MKTMRINKTMRIGVIAAFVAILTIVGIAGTFAKYTAAGGAQNYGRVAKWGIKVHKNTATNNIFLRQYATDDESAKKEITNSVEYDSSLPAPGYIIGANEGLLAPGTTVTADVNVDQAGYSFEGKSEVATRVTPTVYLEIPYLDESAQEGGRDNRTNWLVTDSSTTPATNYFYFPINITLCDKGAGDTYTTHTFQKTITVDEITFNEGSEATVLGLNYSGVIDGTSHSHTGYAESLKTYVSALVKAYLQDTGQTASKDFPAGTDFSQTITGLPTATIHLKWQWPISQPWTALELANCDILDTFLGNEAAKTTPNPSYMILGDGYEITQID